VIDTSARSAPPASRAARWGGLAVLGYLAAMYLYAVLSGFRTIG
jgi:hypothetical protein